MIKLPLYTVIRHLRQHSFLLGISDYLLLLKALNAGIGTGSRKELIQVCQTMWGKSVAEQTLIAELLDTYLPPGLTQKEIEQWCDEDSILDGLLDDDLQKQNPDDSLLDDGADAAESDANVDEADETMYEDTKVEFHLAEAVASVSLHTKERQNWLFNTTFDFVGTLPISSRQMKRAWRYYRRMQRTGPRTELAIDATINKLHQDGVLAKPVLVQRRTNQAHLLLLIDCATEMIPFRHITNELVETAKNSGLRQIIIRYFQKIPNEIVYGKEDFSVAENIEPILSSWIGNGILIISDGGAAKESIDTFVIKRSVSFIQRLQRTSQNIAWLNPMPPERWQNSSIAYIQRRTGIPMFTFNRSGLDQAVDILRGKMS